MSKRDDDHLDLTVAGTWRKEDEPPLSRWSLRTGGKRYEVWTDQTTAEALFTLLQTLPATVERLERERDRLAGEVDDLTTERDALERKSKHAAQARLMAVPPKAQRATERASSASLADVPLSMIGTFRPDDPKLKAAAKKDPLMALAVQVAKATAPDASALDQARLRAMAAAVSRGDLESFWSASAERSKKKLGA
jgi:hypothetical protein